MGFSLSWVAVRTDNPHAVQHALALRGTGEREEMRESEITAAALPGGWYLVVSNRDKLNLERDEVLSRLSRIGQVVMSSVEEHVMYSSAACWRDGARSWSVYHQGEDGIDNLVVNGAPPTFFSVIRDRFNAQQAIEGGNQAHVDYIFEIPIELAYSIAGYRHDIEMTALGKDAFEVLAATKTPPERRWWRRLIAHRPS
jgi:hypothetical protein